MRLRAREPRRYSANLLATRVDACPRLAQSARRVHRLVRLVNARPRLYLVRHGETTLVVGHGRMLRILVATALGLPPSFSRSLRMRNCRPAVLEPGPRPLLLALNLGDPSFEARLED